MSEAQNGGMRMKRLTIPDVRVDEHTTRRTMIDVEAVREHAMDFYWRLKAYEDTGLMPDETRAMQEEHFSGLEMAKLHSALMELKKYQEADRSGRLVVLPCKVGDTLYEVTGRKTISEYRVKAIRVELFCVFIEWEIEKGFVWQSLTGITQNEIGKTVFLTREEAEKALEAMKMAEYIERTSELVLATNAGARVIENSKRYHGAFYIRDAFAPDCAKIAYLQAAKVLRDIEEAPAADVAPVMHSYWESYDCSQYMGTDEYGEPKWRDGKFYVCHNRRCRRKTVVKSHYCPHCGAKMDGGADHDT